MIFNWQYIFPKVLFSNLLGKLSNCEWKWFKNLLIYLFCKAYKVDLSIAESSNFDDYPSFNRFFTRHLKSSARPIDLKHNSIVSPIDGMTGYCGTITNDLLLQAKNHSYTVSEILANQEVASLFNNGWYYTFYLSPRDYHRIHAPFDGKLVSVTHVPGMLFSVSPSSLNSVGKIFARNERVIVRLDTDFGPLVCVLIGAMGVGSIETIWTGCITPPHGKTEIKTWYYNNHDLVVSKGQEIGCFHMGSSVVMLLPEGANMDGEVVPGNDQAVEYGKFLGNIR